MVAALSAAAWYFPVPSTVRNFSQLAPGTLVHVSINPRRNKLLSIEPIERPAVARQFADAVVERPSVWSPADAPY
jgi:hypothetical protein